MSVRIVATTVVAATIALAGATLTAQAAALDYEYFKAKVQPIFLTKREGHARCVMCHAEANNMLHLQKLPEGQTTWSEEDTRKNFDTVSKIIQAVRRSADRKNPAASARPRGRRRRVPFRRPAIRRSERPVLEDDRRLGEGCNAEVKTGNPHSNPVQPLRWVARLNHAASNRRVGEGGLSQAKEKSPTSPAFSHRRGPRSAPYENRAVIPNPVRIELQGHRVCKIASARRSNRYGLAGDFAHAVGRYNIASVASRRYPKVCRVRKIAI